MTNETTERNINGWLKQPEDPRDYQIFQFHPELLRASIPDSFDLVGPNMPPIQDQGALGSCVSWAVVRAFRYAQRKMGLPDYDGSELYTYYNARAYQGWENQDSGSFLRDGVKALADHGNAEDSTWPYIVSKFTQKPPVAAYSSGSQHQAIRYMSVPNNEAAVKAVIAGGYPIVFGITLYQNFPMGSGVSVIPMPQGQVIGGHAMAFTGYRPGGRQLDNSWSANWGVNGRAWMPEAYAIQASDLWAIEAVEGEIIPPPTPDPVPPTPDPVPPTPDPVPPAPQPAYWTHMQLWKSDGKFDFAAIIPPPWA